MIVYNFPTKGGNNLSLPEHVCLSIDENIRKENYKSTKLKLYFEFGRSLLRYIIGFLLDIDPSKVIFCYGPRGKPHFIDIDGREPIHFNLSNTEGLVSIAVSLDHTVGIDAERLSATSFDDLHALTLSELEQNSFKRIPDADRGNAFLQLWTRKEALLKAAGTGLSDDLKKYDVLKNEGHKVQIHSHSGQKEDRFFDLNTFILDGSHIVSVAHRPGAILEFVSPSNLPWRCQEQSLQPLETCRASWRYGGSPFFNSEALS